MPKKLLTTRQEYANLELHESYELLHNTELTVHRLERIIESLLMCKEGSKFYDEVIKDYQHYLDN